MFLTKSTRPNNRLEPQEIAIPSLDANVLCRRISAGAMLEIDEKFPAGGEDVASRRKRAAAIVSKTVIDDTGESLWSPEELLETLDATAFAELTEVVAVFMHGANQKKTAA